MEVTFIELRLSIRSWGGFFGILDLTESLQSCDAGITVPVIQWRLRGAVFMPKVRWLNKCQTWDQALNLHEPQFSHLPSIPLLLCSVPLYETSPLSHTQSSCYLPCPGSHSPPGHCCPARLWAPTGLLPPLLSHLLHMGSRRPLPYLVTFLPFGLNYSGRKAILFTLLFSFSLFWLKYNKHSNMCRSYVFNSMNFYICIYLCNHPN